MAGSEQYSLVETSEERNLIKSTKLTGEIRVRTLLLGWFMAERLLSHLAMDGNNVTIRSTRTRQSFTSSGFDVRRFENIIINWIVCPLSAESGMQHGPRIKDTFLLFLSREISKVLNKETNFIIPIGGEGLRYLSWVECSDHCRVPPEDFQTLTSSKSGVL